jgi:hypothetical protein
MKKIVFIFICASMLSSYCKSQDFFVKVDFIHRYVVMIESVTMYYKVNSLDSVKNNIENLDSFSEREFLKLWGLPLLDNTYVEDPNCKVDHNANNLKELFDAAELGFFLYSKNYVLGITVMKLNASVCTFYLMSKTWPYDVLFYTGGAIESYTILETDKHDVEQIKKIVNLLDDQLHILDH